MKFKDGDLVYIKKRTPQNWGGYVPELDKFVGMDGVVIDSIYVSDYPHFDTNHYRIELVNGDRWSFPEEVLAMVEPLQPGNLSGLLRSANVQSR